MKLRFIGIWIAALITVQSHLAGAKPLVERVDATENKKLAVADAISDFRELEAVLNSLYVYRDFYEQRNQFRFSQLVDSQVTLLQRLSDSGQIFSYQLRAAMSESTSAFRDSHSYVALQSNSDLTLPIGLYYFPAIDEYLVYRGNDEIYRQLQQTAQQFADSIYVITELSGIPIKQVLSEFDHVLPYTNLTTRRNYAAGILTSRKGIVHLAALIKQGRLPSIDERIELKLKSKLTGDMKTVSVALQPLLQWDINDPVAKIEGRSTITYTDYSPDHVMKLFGIKYSEVSPKISYFRIPSWQPDVRPEHSRPTADAMIDFFRSKLALINHSPDATLLIDVRGNRGGMPLMWRPFVEKVMTSEVMIAGILQLDPDLLTRYQNGQRSGDYLDYSYFPNDPSLSQRDQQLITDRQTELIRNGVIKNGRIFQNSRLSEPLYSIIHRSSQPFSGNIYVLTDRYTFSATDTFLRALREAAPGRVLFIGERGEGGSGTGGKVVLTKSGFTMTFGSFASLDPYGIAYENDINDVDLRLELPIEHFHDRDRWFLDKALELIATTPH